MYSHGFRQPWTEVAIRSIRGGPPPKAKGFPQPLDLNILVESSVAKNLAVRRRWAMTMRHRGAAREQVLPCLQVTRLLHPPLEQALCCFRWYLLTHFHRFPWIERSQSTIPAEACGRSHCMNRLKGGDSSSSIEDIRQFNAAYWQSAQTTYHSIQGTECSGECGVHSRPVKIMTTIQVKQLQPVQLCLQWATRSSSKNNNDGTMPSRTTDNCTDTNNAYRTTANLGMELKGCSLYQLLTNSGWKQWLTPQPRMHIFDKQCLACSYSRMCSFHFTVLMGLEWIAQRNQYKPKSTEKSTASHHTCSHGYH